MQFVSYQSISIINSPVNSGSYLSTADDALLNFSMDNSNIWYGTSNSDIIELGIWDLDQTLMGWGVITGSTNVTASNSYLNSLNYPTGFSHIILNNGFITYNNSNILINPPNDLNTIGSYNNGSHLLTYNPVRNMAGDQNSPLVIKEISPSRTEIKLLPQGSETQKFINFYSNQVIISDIYQQYIDGLISFPANSIYNKIKSQYTDSIETIHRLSSLKTDTDIINYIINIYEDVYSYSNVDNNGITTRIQGIKSYFFNHIMDNLSSSITFENLDLKFIDIANSVIDTKISQLSNTITDKYYTDIKKFIYDFIVLYHYQVISDKLSISYNNIYKSPLKNGLNFGQNQLYPILNNGAFNEADGSISLVIKLKDPLPSNLSMGDTCWISNISLSPIILNVLINDVTPVRTYAIKGPDFSIKDKNVLATGGNEKYSINDINLSLIDTRNISISKKIKELTIDYTDFTKFIIFSSAEVRLKIFKNKKIQLDILNSTIDLLNIKNQDYITLYNTTYPFYASELLTLNDQMDSIVESFDGYESYLFDSGIYDTLNGDFINTSLIQDLESSASEYDIQNRDSLIKNTPKYILEDTNNDEYIIFLSMIGHFFDNIYIYISNLPSAKVTGNSLDTMLSNKMVSAILEEMGWDITDILSEDNILNYNLTGANSAISSADRIKIIENRILKNLPLIYKTKGTQQSVDLLLACYGIPQSLLNIKEYGGYVHSSTGSCDFYERAYLYTWDESAPNDMFTLDGINSASSYMFKVRFNNPDYYSKGDDNILMGAINNGGRPPRALIPAMTSDTTPSGIASGCKISYDYYYPFAQSDSHPFVYFNTFGNYIAYQFSSPKIVTRLKVTGPLGADRYSPFGDWPDQKLIFQGSTDGVTYYDIGNTPYNVSSLNIDDVFSNTTAYSYYKFKVETLAFIKSIQLYGIDVPSLPSSSSAEGSGDWAVGFTRTDSSNSGTIYFRSGYKGYEVFKLESPEFSLFDGNIYSVLIRKNDIDSNFDIDNFTGSPNQLPRQYDLSVKRNNSGDELLNISSSYINYDEYSNDTFDGNPGNTRLVIGGWFLPHNSKPLVGSFDKLEIFQNVVSDTTFEDYVNNINSYSNNQSGSQQDLLFRMSVDYPFDIRSSSIWPNSNSLYSTYLSSSNAWEGATTSSFDTSSCQTSSIGIYPYQFTEVEYLNTINSSFYGPNQFNTNKVNNIDQKVVCRLDNLNTSTQNTEKLTPSSNLLGLFLDPQDFKNKDIVRQLGSYDLMTSIGDPSSMYDNQYLNLKQLQSAYVDSLQNKQQTTLFGELMTIYRLYFNKSIFSSIKKLLPARANVVDGILIAPTILERPKYPFKPVTASINTGDVGLYEIILPRSASFMLTSSVEYMAQDGYNPYDFELNILANKNDSVTYQSIGYIPYSLDDTQLESYVNPITKKVINSYFPYSSSAHIMKRWKKYRYSAVDDSKIDSSASVYLYDYVKVSDTVFNSLASSSKSDTGDYFELVSGYPRNHHSHKQNIFTNKSSFNSAQSTTYKKSEIDYFPIQNYYINVTPGQTKTFLGKTYPITDSNITYKQNKYYITIRILSKNHLVLLNNLSFTTSSFDPTSSFYTTISSSVNIDTLKHSENPVFILIKDAIGILN